MRRARSKTPLSTPLGRRLLVGAAVAAITWAGADHLHQAEYSAGASDLLVAWGIVGFWLGVVFKRSRCGGRTARGTACRHTARGYLFGCHEHYWMRFGGYGGWPTPPSRHPPRQPAASRPPPSTPPPPSG